MNWLHHDHLGEFLNEAELLGAGVEVGAMNGTFAAMVLARWRGRGLTLVDPWEMQPASTYFDSANVPAAHTTAYAAAVRLADADPRVRLVRDFSLSAANHVPDRSLDFVYIDGNHSYPAVMNDLRAWYSKLRPGGLLAGHHYLDGILGGCLFGVKMAVDDFAQAVGLAPAFTTADLPFASWYLRKPLGPPPRPENMTLLTAYDAAYAAVGDIARANKEAYCRRHGYRFVCRRDGFDLSRPLPWSKVLFIRQELPCTEWVFWSDADALVMNSAIPLTRFVQDSVDVVLSGDPYHGINTGHLFVRNTRGHNNSWIGCIPGRSSCTTSGGRMRRSLHSIRRIRMCVGTWQ